MPKKTKEKKRKQFNKTPVIRLTDWDLGSVVSHWGHFLRFIPQVPLTHPDDPLDGEFGEISSLEERHEDAAEDGNGAPGIGCYQLL